MKESSEFKLLSYDLLADCIRSSLVQSNETVTSICNKSGVSRSYIYSFIKGEQVCFDILNRLANCLGIAYTVSNATRISNATKEFTSIKELIDYIRSELYNSAPEVVARSVGLGKTHLYNFRSGKAMCMKSLDKLCCYFNVSYIISSFNESETKGLKWAM